MSQQPPFLFLPTNAVLAQGPEFLDRVARPWLAELDKHRHRFRVPPYVMPEVGMIDVKATRWITPGAPAEIGYYAAVEGTDGTQWQKTPEGGPMIVWAECPIKVPDEFVAIAGLLARRNGGHP